MTLDKYLKDHILIIDGAMGTYYERQEDGRQEYAEQAGIYEPELIQRIHGEYITAGAKLIRTNTFAANHRLFPKKEDCQAVIEAGVKNAKVAIEKSGKDIFLAASIGPVRFDEDETMDDKKEYQWMIDCFIKQGVHNFVFETFGEYEEIGLLAQYIKSKVPDAFVLVQFSLYKTGYTSFGISADRILKRLSNETSVDGIGFNCGIGVSHMYKVLSTLSLPEHKWMSAIPNAVYQTLPRGKRVYNDNYGYLANQMEKIVRLGVNIIGGCCGTTPAHIQELSQRYQDSIPIRRDKVYSSIEDKEKTQFSPKPLFLQKIEKKEKIYAVELDPPFHSDATKMITGAKLCQAEQVDLITIADSPMAKARADSFLTSALLAQTVSVPVMPHIACRDRNLIALRAGVMGSYMNGNRQMLVVTGDPVGMADREQISSVFDMNSIRFMGYIHNMNEEIYQQDPIYYGGALNYSGVNVDAIIKKMKKKMEQGCSYFLSQPVYSMEDGERIRYLKEQTGAVILIGIMPLVSYKNALFMKEEMPGIHVPDSIVSMFHKDMTREEAQEVSKKICVDIANLTKEYGDGYYLMTPFNRVELVTSIIKAIRNEIR